MQGAICRKCGSSGFYLQQKGMQVGVYCDCCGAWEKWASKQDQQIYRNRGVKVYPQGIEIQLKGSSSNMGVEIKPISDLGTVDFGVVKDNVVPNSAKPSSIDIDAEVERRVQEALANIGKSSKSSPIENTPTFINNSLEFENNLGTEESSVNQGVGFCPVCEGNPLETKESSKVEVFIYGGVLSVTDSEGTEILGLYELKYCPHCGKMFKK